MKSKILKKAVLITAAAASLSFPANVMAAGGDVNGDGKINVIDFMLVKSVLSGDKTYSENADINGDGTVNSSDAVMMAEYLLGIRTEFPENNPPAASGEEKITSVTASDDITVRGDGKDDDVNILNVAGFNAAVRRNVYLKFSAAELDCSDVRRAEIELKLSDTANGDCEVKIAAVPSSWDESNPPEYESSPSGTGICDSVVTKHTGDRGKIIKFDVTDAVRDNPDAEEYSFVLFCDHENNGDAVSNLALFSSKENTAESSAPRLVVRSGGEKEEQAQGTEADNTKVRFEISTKSGTFLRVNKSGSVSGGRNISPLTDAFFEEKEGLAGKGTVSFESASQQGMFMCRRNGSGEVYLAKNDGSEEFIKNSSFVKTKGLSAGTSYEAYGLPGRWLMYTGSGLVVSSADTDARKDAASFKMRSHKNVIMEDEFEGDRLDTSVWAYSYPWADHHNYSAVVRESQVAVKDGKLVLTATRVAGDNWIKDDKGETGYTDNIGEKKWRKYSHLTGVVHLPFSRYPLSGNLYMEGRFRMPDRSGFWPAFWLNGNNSWPPEIDIFEYLSNTPEKIYVGIHRQDSSRENGDGGAGWWIERTASFFQKEFHTYALDWGETYINYYIDDILVKSIEDKAYIQNQKNMYLIINLGVGGWAEEPTDSTGDNTTYECDFVHIYGY